MVDFIAGYWPVVALSALTLLMLLAVRLLFGEGRPPYEKRDALLSNDARRFYSALREAVGEDGVVLSMVRLADLIRVTPGTSKRQTWQNRINAKNVDFVVCDGTTFEPRLVVEIDRRRRKREALPERDRFVENALGAAGLPLLRKPPEPTYDIATLRKAIDERLKKSAA
ncbi:MAG: DUF2726 domain-containing protein [Pirellulaceae bacterium]